MTSFESITQFHDKYKELGNYTTKRNACGLFSLIVAEKFITSADITPDSYINSLDSAVIAINDLKLNGFQYFEDLLQFQTTYTNSDITYTSVDMINDNIVGFDVMFPNLDVPYSVIFLKDAKFFTVNIIPDALYSIRDCHDAFQYDFPDKNQLIGRLCDIYRFTEMTIVDGVELSEFSTIEFLIITNPLNLKFDSNRSLNLTDGSDKTNQISLRQSHYDPRHEPPPKVSSEEFSDFKPSGEFQVIRF